MCRFQCMGTAPDMHCTPAAAHVHKPYQFLQQTSVPALFTTEKKKTLVIQQNKLPRCVGHGYSPRSDCAH